MDGVLTPGRGPRAHGGRGLDTAEAILIGLWGRPPRGLAAGDPARGPRM